YRDIEKHTPDDKLAQLRSEHSDLTDKEFHDSYDSYDLELYIEVRFTDGKLTYLAVSKGESYKERIADTPLRKTWTNLSPCSRCLRGEFTSVGSTINGLCAYGPHGTDRIAVSRAHVATGH